MSSDSTIVSVDGMKLLSYPATIEDGYGQRMCY